MTEQILIIIFIASLIPLLHTNIFYPMHLYIKSKFKKRTMLKESNFTPKVTVIISCFNEEAIIEQVIRNFLATDYKTDNFEIFIGSDGSTDQTNDILKKIASESNLLKIFLFKERRGKSAVLNDLIPLADSEILILSDANSFFTTDAIRNLANCFEDESIGAVSGKLKLLKGSINLGANKEKSYWNFESWLKEMEGAIGKLLGANGGIYAIRKSLFKPIPLQTPVPDDFYISLKILEQNKKVVFEKNAIATEYIAMDLTSEFQRKVRIVSRSISSLLLFKQIVLFKRGFISYQLWSHKIFRWLMPVFLLGLFLTSYLLTEYNIVFSYFFWVQFIFYSLSIFNLIGWIKKIKIPLLGFGSYFVTMNGALIVAFYKILFGNPSNTWQPIQRKRRKS